MENEINRSSIGILIYYEPYYNISVFQFYWGGDNWTDPTLLDLYYDRDKIIENWFNNDENKFDEFFEDYIMMDNMTELLENTYTFNREIDFTENFFKNVEIGWKWVNVVPNAYAD